MDLKKIIHESLLKYLNEQEDYKGEHSAPSKEDAPLYNLKDTYPDDIYSTNGARYYGDNGGDSVDNESISIIQSAKNKPNKPIKVYRAVPDLNKPITDKLKELYYIRNYRHKFPFFPQKNKIVYDLEEKYKDLSYNDMEKAVLVDIDNQVNELENNLKKPLKINSGDWVTINKQYAKEHGISNLKNSYKIISKVVTAKELFTDGNSIHEWGYNI